MPAISRRIYLASSWRCELYLPMLSLLRTWGHDVYDFRDRGFSWSDVDESWDGEETSVHNIKPLLDNAISLRAWHRDLSALKMADTLVLCLPCGSSAHAEFGYAVGAGKSTAVVVPESGEVRPDLTWLLADIITGDTDTLRYWLALY